MLLQFHSDKWTAQTENATTEQQILAILHRAERETVDRIDGLRTHVSILSTDKCQLLEELQASKNLAQSVQKENKKLTLKVKGLEVKLKIAEENVRRCMDELKSTEAQVNTLLAEKQRSSFEREALFQHVSELEVACQEFLRRAV